MRANISRWLNGISLLALGGVLISFCLNGRIERYLHPQFRPWVMVGGLAFCGAGIVYLLAKRSLNCCVDGVCVHANPQSSWRAVTAFGVVVLPLATGAFVSKDAFDAQAIINRGFVQDASTLPGSMAKGNVTAKNVNPTSAARVVSAPGDQLPPDSSADYLPKAADGNIALEVTDLLYGETQESLRKMFEGKTVEVIGQYLPGDKPTEGKLVRMFIVCCAADARPVAVPVQGDKPAGVSDMTWVKVTGRATFTGAGDHAKVLVKADKLEPTDPPSDAMLY